MSHKALLIIDLQNDYFPNGKFPLWNTAVTLNNIKAAISNANAQGIPVIHVQHLANPAAGIAPFFNRGTSGAEIHADIMAAAPSGEIVVKTFADAFEQTNLNEVLEKHGIDELLICGMMTQNCVTHTAISKAAEKYHVSVLTDCCTTVDEMIHNIALNALGTRVSLVSSDQAL
ncbi:cysteine hydrolase family protein [Vibrio sp.]|uniref:cysteine hydrolase family protein n=1 Tax=Vibrio sp. TaxID=678 RepID=UPI003D0D627E